MVVKEAWVITRQTDVFQLMCEGLTSKGLAPPPSRHEEWVENWLRIMKTTLKRRNALREFIFLTVTGLSTPVHVCNEVCVCGPREKSTSPDSADFTSGSSPVIARVTPGASASVGPALLGRLILSSSRQIFLCVSQRKRATEKAGVTGKKSLGCN